MVIANDATVKADLQIRRQAGLDKRQFLDYVDEVFEGELSMILIALDAAHSVREAAPSDVSKIADIWLEGVASAFGGSALEIPPLERVHEQILKLVRQQSCNFKFWLCLNEVGETIGWSTVQPFHTTPLESERESYGFISTYMSGARRGQGIGSRLMRFTVDYCRERTNIVYVLGLQDRSNAASVTMTDRAGFCDFGQLPAVQGLHPCSIIVCTTNK